MNVYQFNDEEEGRRWRNGKKMMKSEKKLGVDGYLQWTCNSMVKIISKNLDINKLTEETNLTNGDIFEGLKRWFYEL